MQDLIGYDEIIERSMRLVIFETLKKTEKSGLLGKHYFVVTFLTRFPGVSLSKALMEKYPDEMTVVIHHQFKNLVVEQDFFKVSLSFSGKYEKLTIPYKCVTSFADPSINFALKFSMTYSDLEEKIGDFGESNHANKDFSKEKNVPEVDLSAKVISLDAFRKNRKDNPDQNS
jgi:uncharacterized protein